MDDHIIAVCSELRPALVLPYAGVADDVITVCSECNNALKKGNVPPASLVRLDLGPWPEDEFGKLPRPTYVEATVIAPYRPLRSVIVLGKGTHYAVLALH